LHTLPRIKYFLKIRGFSIVFPYVYVYNKFTKGITKCLERMKFMSNILRFMGVNKDTTTAGPGKRLEFFTKGCIRGVIAPCQGCFNEATWTFEGQFRGLTVDEVVDICDRDAWNRQVTFCGGEPILQAKLLTDVAKRLKEKDLTFHFVMYTAYKLDTLMKYGLKFTWVKEKHGDGMKDALESYSDTYQILEYEDLYATPNKIKFTILTPTDVKDLMKYIDLIVDGDFQMDKRLTTHEYMHDGWFIGSSNQRVIDGPRSVQNHYLSYVGAKEYNQDRQKHNHCKACGHLTKESYCDFICEYRYVKRKENMKLLGGV
jgi:organic radical activating enzyme